MKKLIITVLSILTTTMVLAFTILYIDYKTKLKSECVSKGGTYLVIKFIFVRRFRML